MTYLNMAIALRSRLLVNVLRLFWIVIALWYELGTFISDSRRCNWPDAVFAVSPNKPHPYHVLVVADPQILDHRSYPGRAPFLTYISRLVVDLNLRKNWRAALLKHPDAVVFLGDMMDGGRFSMSDDEYESYYRRFKSIFRLDAEIPQYFIPGNHDTGLGASGAFSPHARSRYLSHFGELNYDLTVANHSLVFVDAPGFVDEDYQRLAVGKGYDSWEPIPGGPIEYLTSFAKEKTTHPIILFSHIPLYRPDGRSCGPLREKGTIRPGVGIGYQNTLGKEATKRLLETLRLKLILSGDDHDYCEYIHTVPSSRGLLDKAREITVKSLSMAMNVRRPGFQLLSLAPDALRGDNPGNPTYADTACLLPDQLAIYLNVYIPFLVLSLLTLFICHLIRGSSLRSRKLLRSGDQRIPDIEDGECKVHPYEHMPRDSSYSLPLSTPASTNQFHWSWTFVLAGKRRRLAINHQSCIALARTLSCCGRKESPRERPRRLGWFSGFMRDVRDVAVFPLAIFILMTWWLFTW